MIEGTGSMIYLKEALPEMLNYAKGIRLDRGDIASLRVMEKNGGRIVGSDDAKICVRIKNPDRS